MDWTSGEGLAALVAVRATHFGATALVAGALLFRAVIADPPTRDAPAVRVVIDAQARRVAAAALAASIVTGIVWFILTTAEIASLSLRDAISFDALSTIAEATQFGSVAIVRISLAIVAGAALAFDRLAAGRTIALAAAIALMASIAWTGHSGSGFGPSGGLQVIADAFHVVAASVWIGALVPFALLLSRSQQYASDTWPGIARAATQRFSVLGIASVATLIASGTVNAWFLVGSSRAMFGTEYGQVLMLKLALFLVMLAFAAVNRMVLTPRLASERRPDAVQTLTRHCVYEIVLGLAIFAVVAWLGTLHPASHFMN